MSKVLEKRKFESDQFYENKKQKNFSKDDLSYDEIFEKYIKDKDQIDFDNDLIIQNAAELEAEVKGAKL